MREKREVDVGGGGSGAVVLSYFERKEEKEREYAGDGKLIKKI